MFVGDRLHSRPCEITITEVDEQGRGTWAWCRTCKAAHCFDRAMYERGDGPWRIGWPDDESPHTIRDELEEVSS